MERQEEINNAAHELYEVYAERTPLEVFKFGAKWADENRHEGWIDVTFMKPEDILIDDALWAYTKNVLVLTSNGDIQITNRFWGNKQEEWRWNVSPYIGERITHWMPLPKAL